jgi:hypothetical protein
VKSKLGRRFGAPLGHRPRVAEAVAVGPHGDGLDDDASAEDGRRALEDTEEACCAGLAELEEPERCLFDDARRR